MANYRLVALDMDGTLLNDRLEISERNAAAIRKALDAGVAVCLATGRGVQNVLPYTDQLGLTTPMITVNGSEIWHRPGELHRRTLMDEAVVRRLRELALESDVWYWAYAVDGIYNRERWVATEDEARTKQWLKFGYYSEDAKLLAGIRETVASWGGLELTNSSELNIELNPLGMTKGAALRELCGMLGIETKQAIAMGDSLNDLSMIREAGLGVAMGNAQQAVKDEADAVTLDNNEDGVAAIIERYVLGG